MKHWSGGYLGLPYLDQGRTLAGIDCWGLCFLVMAAHGRPVPSYAGLYASHEERREIAGLIQAAKPEWKRVQPAQELDLVSFRRGGLESHIGIVVRPGTMLHITRDKPSCLERYDAGYWAGRLTGTWRYAGH